MYVAMSRVKSFNGLQFVLTPPPEKSMAVKNYNNNVVFKSAVIISKIILCQHNINANMGID